MIKTASQQLEANYVASWMAGLAKITFICDGSNGEDDTILENWEVVKGLIVIPFANFHYPQ